MTENQRGAYGIVANVFETDRLFPDGAKVWIAGGTGGEGWYRFRWLGRTRGGRIIVKWAPTMRFQNFRAAWVPEHLEDRVTYLRGTRDEMESLAVRLESFAAQERVAHPSRRGTSAPTSAWLCPFCGEEIYRASIYEDVWFYGWGPRLDESVEGLCREHLIAEHPIRWRLSLTFRRAMKKSKRVQL